MNNRGSNRGNWGNPDLSYICDEGAQNLAQGIIDAAKTDFGREYLYFIREYGKVLSVPEINELDLPDHRKSAVRSRLYAYENAKKFFCSDWYKMLLIEKDTREPEKIISDVTEEVIRDAFRTRCKSYIDNMTKLHLYSEKSKIHAKMKKALDNDIEWFKNPGCKVMLERLGSELTQNDIFDLLNAAVKKEEEK